MSEYQSHVTGCDQCQVLCGGMKKDCGGEEKVSCEQQMTKRQPSQVSSSPNTHHVEKSIMATRNEKTWTLQLGVLERQQKNLEILLEEQRKMISRLRQENERTLQQYPPCVFENKHTLTTASSTHITDDVMAGASAASTLVAPTTSIMPCCDAVQVTGAGVEQVNGIYKRTGSWDNVGMYTKKDIWEDNGEQTFTLYRCNTYNNSKRWCISILPTTTVFDSSATCNSHSACTAVDIDFYQQEAMGSRGEVPGMVSSQWVSLRGGNGVGIRKDSPPSVTYLPAI